MKSTTNLIPNLFRTEFSKMVSVLTKHFGIENISIAEDFVSDTFLLAAETWGSKGIPKEPTAWLYKVAKNKAIDYFRRKQTFQKKIVPSLKNDNQDTLLEIELDLSEVNILDSQLKMMFVICHPSIKKEAQIGLALRILCGFGINEIASAFLTKKATINKRLFRAKEKIKEVNIKMELPDAKEINIRLDAVLTTLYLLFNEGYYSSTKNNKLQKNLCYDAMRLNYILTKNPTTNLSKSNALMALMCFHASRFQARTNFEEKMVLYKDQDTSLWDWELIRKGEFYLEKAIQNDQMSKFHLEAAIAYAHTEKKDSKLKWENILQLYNRLLQIEYSPIAALNRTYALSKAHDIKTAIKEAKKLKLNDHHLYFALLGNLYKSVDRKKAIEHYNKAMELAKTDSEKNILKRKISKLK